MFLVIVPATVTFRPIRSTTCLQEHLHKKNTFQHNWKHVPTPKMSNKVLSKQKSVTTFSREGRTGMDRGKSPKTKNCIYWGKTKTVENTTFEKGIKNRVCLLRN